MTFDEQARPPVVARDLPPTLREKLRRLSLRPDGGDASLGGREIIVLAADPANTRKAFEMARERTTAGACVRVVAHGATLEASWPSWVTRSSVLRLTEPGAFKQEPLVESTAELQASLREWLDRRFAGIFDAKASDLLFTSACARFLQTPIATYPLAHAMGQAFRDGEFVCMESRGFHTINGGWDPSLFAKIVATYGARVTWLERPPTRPGRPRWSARIVATGTAGLAGAVLRQIRSHAESRGGRALIRALRSEETPESWVTVIPDWERVNTIAIDAFALPMLAAGTRLGILLVDNLREGARDEANMRRVTRGAERWPGFGRLREASAKYVVEQAVAPDSVRAFAAALLRGAAGATRALARHLEGPEVDAGGTSLDLSPYAWPLVALSTLDVLRGVLVEAAARDVVRRHSMKGRVAVVSCSSTVSLAAADCALQRAGAVTLNSPDGSGSDTWSGVGSTVSTARAVWTHADARSIGSSCRHVVVAGMPVRMEGRRSAALPSNVLILNNHGHREFCAGGVFREHAFQAELLRVAEELRQRVGGHLRFRWRPHPAATEPSIAAGLAAVQDVELSPKGTPLEVDARWADIVVCGYSTTIMELLFADVPVFVQARAELIGLPALDFVSEERCFFFAREAAEKIAAYIDNCRRAPTAGPLLAPELAARERLYGPGGRPADTMEALNFAKKLSRGALLG